MLDLNYNLRHWFTYILNTMSLLKTLRFILKYILIKYTLRINYLKVSQSKTLKSFFVDDISYFKYNFVLRYVPGKYIVLDNVFYPLGFI